VELLAVVVAPLVVVVGGCGCDALEGGGGMGGGGDGAIVLQTIITLHLLSNFKFKYYGDKEEWDEVFVYLRSEFHLLSCGLESSSFSRSLNISRQTQFGEQWYWGTVRLSQVPQFLHAILLLN